MYFFIFYFFINRHFKDHNPLLSTRPLVGKHVFVNFADLSSIRRVVHTDHWTRLINHFVLLRHRPEHAMYWKVVLSHEHICIMLSLSKFYKHDSCWCTRYSYRFEYFYYYFTRDKYKREKINEINKGKTLHTRSFKSKRFFFSYIIPSNLDGRENVHKTNYNTVYTLHFIIHNACTPLINI